MSTLVGPFPSLRRLMVRAAFQTLSLLLRAPLPTRNAYESSDEATTRSGLSDWMRAHARWRHVTQARSCASPFPVAGCTSATGHEDLVMVISFQPRCSATLSRAGSQWAACESPVRMTSFRPARGPKVQVHAPGEVSVPREWQLRSWMGGTSRVARDSFGRSELGMGPESCSRPLGMPSPSLSSYQSVRRSPSVFRLLGLVL